MTQPPDEEPTVAWTPPETPPADPEVPAPADAAPASVTPPADATQPDADPVQSPLISWAPSGGVAAGSAGAAGAAGASGTAGATGATAAAGGAGDPAGQPDAVVGWEAPSTAVRSSAVEGYQVAGVGSRIVAWLFDVAIIAILSVVIIVVILLIAPDAFARDSFAAGALSAILTTGLSFLYFVGLWTSGSGATLGMRSVGLRLVDAPGPRPLAIGPAVVRWAAFGYPISLLTLVPVLGSVASWALIGWTIVLLISTAMSDTNQGLHDRFAGSAVLRRIGAGSGWAVIGCIGLIALSFIGLILLPIIALATLSPEMQDQFWNEMIRQMELEMERQS
jgi:uncharacterized RDD family membrane protein YckC